jgi:hypothetical protein
MVRNRQSQDIYREVRKRMIRETERFLEECLRHPEHMVRIPAIPVGRGRFSRQFAGAFWTQTLGVPAVMDATFRRVICRLFRR